MFKDSPEGKTHSYQDGCGMREHNQSIDEPQKMLGISKLSLDNYDGWQRQELKFAKKINEIIEHVNKLEEKVNYLCPDPYL